MLINDSEQVVSIKQLVASCGCTKVSASKKELEPGKSCEINLTIDPSQRRGFFDVQVIVELQILGKKSAAQLKLVGYISTKYRLSRSHTILQCAGRSDVIVEELSTFYDKESSDVGLSALVTDPAVTIEKLDTLKTGSSLIMGNVIQDIWEIKCDCSKVKDNRAAKLQFSPDDKARGLGIVSLEHDIFLLGMKKFNATPKIVTLAAASGSRASIIVDSPEEMDGHIFASSDITDLRLTTKRLTKRRFIIDVVSDGPLTTVHRGVLTVLADGKSCLSIPISIIDAKQDGKSD